MIVSSAVRSFFMILVLTPLSVQAQRPFEPAVATERDHQTFVVNTDGTYSQTMERAYRTGHAHCG